MKYIHEHYLAGLCSSRQVEKPFNPALPYRVSISISSYSKGKRTYTPKGPYIAINQVKQAVGTKHDVQDTPLPMKACYIVIEGPDIERLAADMAKTNFEYKLDDYRLSAGLCVIGKSTVILLIQKYLVSCDQNAV